MCTSAQQQHQGGLLPKTLPVSTKKKSMMRSRSNSNGGHQKTHIVTHHNYHDHARDPILVKSSSNNASSSCTSSSRGGVVTAFPVKLYEMLQHIQENSLHSHVVSWQPHGRCFVVHDTNAFKNLLPQYKFKLSKIASFQRQLNLYGFQRLTTGPDKNGYYHELFLKGRPDLVHAMQRSKVKGTGVRAKANPSEEPNLYSYPPIQPVSGLTASGGGSDDSQQQKPHQTMVPATASPLSGLFFDSSVPTINVPPPQETLVLQSPPVKPFAVSPRPDLEEQHQQENNLKEDIKLVTMTDAPSAMSLSTILAPTATAPAPTLIPSDSTSAFNSETSSETDPSSEPSSPSSPTKLVSFDRLIDEMFRSNQSLQFNELVELATYTSTRNSASV